MDQSPCRVCVGDRCGEAFFLERLSQGDDCPLDPDFALGSCAPIHGAAITAPDQCRCLVEFPHCRRGHDGHLHSATSGLDNLGGARQRRRGRMAHCFALGPRLPRRPGPDMERRRGRYTRHSRVRLARLTALLDRAGDRPQERRIQMQGRAAKLGI